MQGSPKLKMVLNSSFKSKHVEGENGVELKF